MEKSIVDLWADIGSEDYWDDLISRSSNVFVPFEERWPQPGFIGRDYFDSPNPVLVMGQNPRASNTSRAREADMEMFRLISKHSQVRTAESLNELFAMMRMFMRGVRYRPAWRPITAVEKHLGQNLDKIAYLNLIPLATHNDRIVPAFRESFELSTKRQLKHLNPAKIVVFGKGAHDKFLELGGHQWDAWYLEQRNFKDAPKLKMWISR